MASPWQLLHVFHPVTRTGVSEAGSANLAGMSTYVLGTGEEMGVVTCGGVGNLVNSECVNLETPGSYLSLIWLSFPSSQV